MEIKRMVLGMLRTNCYIAYTEDSKRAVVIDPAAASERIMEMLSELSVMPEAVLLTHGHFDHMLAADALRKEYHIPICLLKEEAELLSDPVKNLSSMFGAAYGITADEFLSDGQILPYLGGRKRSSPPGG